MKPALTMLLLLLPVTLLAQSARIASDFELAQMEKQAASANDFTSRIQAHLNLGDLRRTRSEGPLARQQYTIAFELASRNRKNSQSFGDVSAYVRATVYAGLAKAKLGKDKEAFALLEEALRYDVSVATLWNIYSIAMNHLGHPKKAMTAARHAVRLAEAEAEKKPNVHNLLDVGVFRYSLAFTLIDNRRQDEAIALLETVVSMLAGKEFNGVRRSIERMEAFEIYSSVSTNEQAYISLLNRSQLQLASLYEERGAVAKARAMYEAVLKTRSDEVVALAGTARLSGKQEERERRYAEAFDANPFVMPLVREYQRFIAGSKPQPVTDVTTTGAAVRRALVQIARGELNAARESLTALNEQFPNNRTLQKLLEETALTTTSTALPGPTPTGEELRRMIGLFAQERVTAEQRIQLDQMTFTSTVTFEAHASEGPAGQTIFESGVMHGVPFRFSEPTAFAGTFAAATPLRLTYRILGATESDSADALLLEPLKLQVAQ